jgi:DNA-binding NarL/FixJ family response regulator
MRLLIVARDAPAAESIRRALRYAPTCRVIGWMDARNQCSGPMLEAQPDVVVIDDSAGPAAVLAWARDVRSSMPDAKIVLLIHELPAELLAEADPGVLTARELEILRHVAEGLSNGRIARELWVTEQTVKFHLSNVYRKLGLANRTEAAHYAHVQGLIGRDLRRRVAVAA